MSEAQKTEDKAMRTIDGFDNFVSRLGLNNDNSLSAGIYTFNLLTRNRVQLEAAYRGSWVTGRVIDCTADDMTRAGAIFTTNEAEEDIKDFQTQISRLGIWNSMNELIKWGRLYGGAIAVMQIEGQDLSTPLDPATVGRGQFKGLVVYDRWQLNPDLERIIRSGPNLGLPAFYSIVTSASTVEPASHDPTGQILVHHSRVIRNIGIQLPFFQAITEMMWGESILERLWDRLISFDSATMSSANLIERANNRTVGIENFREIIAAGGKAQQGLEAQFEMMRQFQTNEGMTLMDKNDTFATSNYTFAGLDGLLIQFGQQLAGASETPLVILFGQSPAGLNSTGESDIRTYYDSIKSKQESRLRPGLEPLFKVMWRSTFGKDQPKDFEFTFAPLWQMSDLDKSTISKNNSDTILAAEGAGVISKSVALKELRQSSKDLGLFTNISDEDIAEAEEIENTVEEPPEPGLGLDPALDPLKKPAESAKDKIKKIFKDWSFKK
jgi:phage-related protein (TIGR01555 family)